MDLREIEWEGVKWMYLFQDRDKLRTLGNMVMNFLVPYKARNFFTS
jgi:hypothetical protein